MEDTYGCNLINTKRDGRQVTEFVGRYHVHILVRQGQMTFSDGKNSFTSLQGDLASQWIQFYASFELVSLLNDTTKTLTEVSDLMHFENVSHFSRYVKKTLGKTPSEYRNK